MKTFTLLLLTLCGCLILSGCKRDPVTDFITTLDNVTDELVKKINAGDFSGAKASFDEKRTGLQDKWLALKKLPEDQVSKEAGDKLLESLKKNLKSLDDAVAAHEAKKPSSENKVDALKWVVEAEMLKKTLEDYRAIFK